MGLHNDIVIPYFLAYANDEQKRRWLPGMCRGELITAIAMTEPNTGSDLAAVRTTAERRGDLYILNGQKTFITNGILSDVVVVVAKTDATMGHKGISLLVVERGMEGFERGRKLDKVGMKAQDTAELVVRGCARAGQQPARRGRQGLLLSDAPAWQGASERRRWRDGVL